MRGRDKTSQKHNLLLILFSTLGCQELDVQGSNTCKLNTTDMLRDWPGSNQRLQYGIWNSVRYSPVRQGRKHDLVNVQREMVMFDTQQHALTLYFVSIPYHTTSARLQ